MKKRSLGLLVAVCVLLLLLPVTVQATSAQAGAFVITGDASGYSFANDALIIAKTGSYTLAMAAPGATTTDTVVVKSGATVNLTLNGVKIDVSATNGACALSATGADLTLQLQGDNTLKSGSGRAGLERSGSDGSLLVQGGANDTLTALGGYAGAGIGGSMNEDTAGITLNARVTAKGGSFAAGVGGGFAGKAETLAVTGGIINATGGMSGAGIGGGSGGGAAEISVSGGNVIAMGGEYAAGIGAGSSAAGNSADAAQITVSGGSVTATGGTGGAGVGGGRRGNAGTLSFSGGSLTAAGGDNGAGIGGGSNGAAQDVSVQGGTLKATGGQNAAALGGGAYGRGDGIVVSGGSVLLTAAAGGNNVGGGAGQPAATPVNALSPAQAVYPATLVVPGVTSPTPVAIASVTPAYYGVKDLVTDETGKITLYLPVGGATLKTLSGQVFTGEVTAGGSNTLTAVPTTFGVAADTSTQNGSLAVSPAQAKAGDTVSVTVAPAQGYRLAAGTLCYYPAGGSAQNATAIPSTNGAYSFAMPAYDVTVTAKFEQIPATSFTITASAGDGGAISPAGDVSVAGGTDKTFTVTAASGYEIADVTVDGGSVGAVSSYTFRDVSANHTITASFRQKQTPVSSQSSAGETSSSQASSAAGTSSVSGGNSVASSSAGGSNPHTGGAAPISALGVLAVLAAAGFIVTRRRPKNK